MPDILIAVIIGGLIASITPIINLIIEHKRWKREKKLEHLKAERRKLEDLFGKNLKEIDKAMENNLYETEMIADIWILMPKKIYEIFDEWMHHGKKTEKVRKQYYIDIVIEMKQSLADIDKKIEDLLS